MRRMVTAAITVAVIFAGSQAASASAPKGAPLRRGGGDFTPFPIEGLLRFSASRRS